MHEIRLTVILSQGLYKVYALVPDGDRVSLTDVGSPRVQHHFATDPYYQNLDRAKMLGYFKIEAERLQRVVEVNQAYLLGETGVAAYIETAADREEVS